MDIDGGLIIRDEKGVPRISLSAKGGIASIVLSDEDGSEMVLELAQGRGRVRFMRAGGTQAAVIASSESAVSVTSFDTIGKPVSCVAIDNQDRVGFIKVFDAAGRVSKSHEVPFS